MNKYEEKQAAKKAYYAEKAEKLEAEAQRLNEYDRKQMSLIPFGQPILVGHHSEGRHRALIKRSRKRADKILSLSRKAEYYRNKATATNNAISSDDEDAIAKLKIKLNNLEYSQNEMKRINKAFRKNGIEGITNLDEKLKAELLKHMKQFNYDIPFPSYSLQNNSAQIRRIKQRILELEKRQKLSPKTIHGNGYTVKENKDDNRIMFIFESKPSLEVREILRKYGFKWSPNRCAWVRMLNEVGRFKSECTMQEFNQILGKISETITS